MKNNSIDQERKDDHLDHALQQQAQLTNQSVFDQVRFVHQSLAGISQDNISLTSHWAGRDHKWPIYINGMTGGTDRSKEFNRKLAALARQMDLPMASGSVSIALKQPEVADSFTVIRQENPDGFVMANLGAHHSLANAQRAVDLLEADAIQIHLNSPQEIVMPEGDRDFSMWLDQIREIVAKLSVPVIVKETGFGMSRETIGLLIEAGVETIDISGRGGTNFVTIENERNDQLDFSSLATWGQTTAESLLEALDFHESATILASGGIRTYLDIAKALAMGARAVGMSGALLRYVDTHTLEESVEHIQLLMESLQRIMLMLGARSVEDLHQVPIVIQGDLKDWALARQIHYQKLANR